MSAYKPALITLAALLFMTAGAIALGFIELPGQQEQAEVASPQPVLASSAAPETQQPEATGGDSCRFCGKPCPACPPPPVDEEICVNLNMLAADYSEAKSDFELTFDLRARWPGYRGSEEIVMAAAQPERRSLELGVCRVEVQPQLGEKEPTLPGVRPEKARDWTQYGAYLIELKDPEGRLIDSLDLKDQHFRRLGLESTDHYTICGIPNRGRFGDRVDVYRGRHNQITADMEPLFSYEVTVPVGEEQMAEDPSGVRQSYVFPRPTLRIYSNVVVEQQKLARAEERKVRYGWELPDTSYLARAESTYSPPAGGGVILGGGSCSGGG